MKFLPGLGFLFFSLNAAAGPVKLIDVVFGFSSSDVKSVVDKSRLVNQFRLAIDWDLQIVNSGFKPTRGQFEEWLEGVGDTSIKTNLVKLLNKNLSETSEDDMVRVGGFLGYLSRRHQVENIAREIRSNLNAGRRSSLACPECDDVDKNYSNAILAKRVFLDPLDRTVAEQVDRAVMSIRFGDDAARRTSFIGKKELEMAKIAVEFGIDVNVEDSFGRTGLFLSVLKKDRHFAEFFIDAGADLNRQNNGWIDDSGPRYTALMIAVTHLDVDMVKMLLEAGADRKLVNSNKQTSGDLAESLVREFCGSRRRGPFLGSKCRDSLAIREFLAER